MSSMGRSPGGVSARHGIEDRQEFPHARDQRHLRGLSGSPEALVEDANEGIAARGGNGGHVQHSAHGGASAPDGTATAQRAAVAGQRCDAHQCRDLLAIQQAELGQLREQGPTRNRPAPRNTLEQIVLGAPQWTLANGLIEIAIDVAQLALEPTNVRSTPAADGAPRAGAHTGPWLRARPGWHGARRADSPGRGSRRRRLRAASAARSGARRYPACLSKHQCQRRWWGPCDLPREGHSPPPGLADTGSSAQTTVRACSEYASDALA